jgi:four helix bundle protein
MVLRVYHATATLPPEERYGLQAQIRRAAVGAASNLVEGCARRTTRDYCHFVNMALASACEARYVITVAARLQMLSPTVGESLVKGFDSVVAHLQKLENALAAME